MPSMEPSGPHPRGTEFDRRRRKAPVAMAGFPLALPPRAPGSSACPRMGWGSQNGIRLEALPPKAPPTSLGVYPEAPLRSLPTRPRTSARHGGSRQAVPAPRNPLAMLPSDGHRVIRCTLGGGGLELEGWLLALRLGALTGTIMHKRYCSKSGVVARAHSPTTRDFFRVLRFFAWFTPLKKGLRTPGLDQKPEGKGGVFM